MTKKSLFPCLILSAFLMLILPAYAHVDLQPGYLRTEYKENPFIDIRQPRLSWELNSSVKNQYQTAYQVLVASSPELLKKDNGDFWDSGKISSNATNQIVYQGKALPSGTKLWWKVRSWDRHGKPGKWSKVATWEMGLNAKDDWQASWIGYDRNHLGKGKDYHLPPASYLRKTKALKGAVKMARLYITSLGLYEFYINGARIGKDYFAPGWTDYHKRVYYQAYDVTSYLKSDKNTFAAVLSAGWYAGYLGYALLVGSPKVTMFYGDIPVLKAQVEVEYNDGSKEIIATDESWRTSEGPLRESDILQGETYDARQEIKDWNRDSFDDADWTQVQVFPDKAGRLLQLHPGNPVQVISELKPKQITEVPGNKYIVDFGQNFAGIVRLKIRGNAGDTITLKYGEMLHPDGNLMVENLRKARATDSYILKGDSHGESWAPLFTYHGFQYVEVSGLKERPAANFLTGVVLSSATPEVGAFKTDNAMLNQLYSNIVWTQRANYFDIPTDCPQRDERLGWTGDAQVYIRSASFNNDIAAFHTKWLTDLNDAQWATGAYPIYAPMPTNETGDAAIRATDTYSPGWSEAGIICPYELYKAYGDLRILEGSLPYMLKFMDFLEKKSGGAYLFKEASFDEINPKGGFGDWLSIGKKTPPDLLATLYYGYCAKLMAEMCEALGEGNLMLRFENDHQKIKTAFINHYSQKDGRFITNAAAYGNGAGYVDGNLSFDGHTQTAYANAIYQQLLAEQEQKMAGYWLKQLVETNDYKLTTGFLGFKPLLPALSESGNQDLAYKLLLSTEYPSLGFEVMNGATSIWERWDSYIKDEGFKHNASMNSFSHYSFGAVNEWMFQYMAGIKSDQAGYRTFSIKPEIAKEGVASVEASYRSINGWIKSSWKKKGKQLRQKVTVPVNTRATIYIPSKEIKRVRLNGRRLLNMPEYKVLAINEHGISLDLGAGNYVFRADL